MKKKILFSLIIALSFIGVYNQSYAVGSNEQTINVHGLYVKVTFDNGNCDGVFVQIKETNGTVVLEGYTAFDGSGQNIVNWETKLPPQGVYDAVAYYNGASASTQFYWYCCTGVYEVHFNFYAECGDE